jgi:hypothetical protein
MQSAPAQIRPILLMAQTQNPLAIALSRVGELDGGRWSVAAQPNPGVPHVAWRFKKPSAELEARIEQVVQKFRGHVAWAFRRGPKNMVIEPVNPPPEGARGTPAWKAFQLFVEKANQDLEFLAGRIETLVRR